MGAVNMRTVLTSFSFTFVIKVQALESPHEEKKDASPHAATFGGFVDVPNFVTSKQLRVVNKGNTTYAHPLSFAARESHASPAHRQITLQVFC